MHYQYDTPVDNQQEMDEHALILSQQLEIFLQPILVLLDAYIDRRLVRTFVEGIATILRFCNPKQGLFVSEVGASIANGKHSEAGSKRLEKLLHCEKWGSGLLSVGCSNKQETSSRS